MDRDVRRMTLDALRELNEMRLAEDPETSIQVLEKKAQEEVLHHPPHHVPHG